MIRSEEDLLRAAVRDLAAESGTPADLASAALAQGRRLRRTRRTAVAAITAVAAMAAVAVPIAVFRDPAVVAPPPAAATSDPAPRPGPSDPPPRPAPSVTSPAFFADEPFRLPGGARLTGISKPGTRPMVLDAEAGGYRTLPKAVLESRPSPDGRHVLVTRSGPQRTELLDLRTGEYRDVPVTLDEAVTWSSDGSRLLITRVDGFAVLEAATGRVAEHPVDAGQQRCLDYCRYTWLSGGTRVALPQAWAINSEPAQVNGVAVFDAGTGKLRMNLPIKGAPTGPDAWSDDGGLVLVSPAPQGSAEVLITEVETRQVLGRFTATRAGFLADGTILGLDDRRITRYDRTGNPLEIMELPWALTGQDLTFAR